MLKLIWPIFLHLLDKHFGRNHKYHKIFNRNNVKISYSCMDNIKNIISSRNKRRTNFYNKINAKTCNSRNKSNCLLDNKCKKLLKLTDKIVYKAEVETNDGINELSTKVNFGISETEFKSIYNNHTMPFRNWTHENDSKLSKFIWSLKDQNKKFGIKWSILKKCFGSKSSNLCLLKKLVISNFKQKERLLNKWLNLVSKCRHENRYINQLLTNSQTHCNLIVIFICDVFCIYKK